MLNTIWCDQTRLIYNQKTKKGVCCVIESSIGRRGGPGGSRLNAAWRVVVWLCPGPTLALP